MRLKKILAGGIICVVFGAAPAFAAGAQKVASGKTQVVARINDLEITIADIRSEISRLGLSVSDPASEKAAVDSIVNRALLSGAARKANMHRQPEAMRRLAAAQDQALADYYIAAVSQPPEPSLAEIEDFVYANKALFSDRKVYNFAVLSMPTARFDADALTPLFDDTRDFTALIHELMRRRIDYAEASVVRAGDGFPAPIREQLAIYGARDNIVIKGETETQIMKITGVREAPVASADAPAIARRLLLQQAAQRRADALLNGLKQRAEITYYRPSLAPGSED